MKPNFPVPVDKPVKFAFNIYEGKLTEKPSTKGTNFWEFVDFNEMPVKRALYSINFLNEVSQKLTKERLIAFLDAMENELNSPDGKITRIHRLLFSLRERTEMIFEPESVYKLASVVYFTDQENPNDYSIKQGFENMARFKTVSDHTFFLSVPIKKCMPQHSLSDEDLLKYLEIAKKINQMELKTVQSMLSKNQSMKDSSSLLQLLNPVD